MANRLILPAVFLGFVAFIIFSTLSVDRVSCSVCVEFQGRKDCRTASADTAEEAIRTATVNACAQVASGIRDSQACERAEPIRVDCSQ